MRGPDAGRTIPFRDFSVSLFTTALEAAEMVVAVRVPTLDPGVGWSFREVARRHGDFAIVACAAIVDARTARLAIGGVADRPLARELPLPDDRALDEALDALDGLCVAMIEEFDPKSPPKERASVPHGKSDGHP